MFSFPFSLGGGSSLNGAPVSSGSSPEVNVSFGPFQVGGKGNKAEAMPTPNAVLGSTAEAISAYVQYVPMIALALAGAALLKKYWK